MLNTTRLNSSCPPTTTLNRLVKRHATVANFQRALTLICDPVNKLTLPACQKLVKRVLEAVKMKKKAGALYAVKDTLVAQARDFLNHRLVQVSELPLADRSKAILECEQQANWLHAQAAEVGEPTAAIELRNTLQQDTAKEAELEQQYNEAKAKRQQTEQQLAAEMEAVRERQVDLEASLNELTSTISESQAALLSELQVLHALPVAEMSVDQVHLLCNSITGVKMPHAILGQWH
eukprot:m.3444 g.3444  ORF g.3444 m.3444 type:complete len:235 (-) comp5367_c0_seq1:81-785(-)